MDERIVTQRLVLEPIAPELARAVVAGETAGLRHAADWPHADTVDALRMVAERRAATWLVVADGEIVGEAGIHRLPDEEGQVEIGFGLAQSARGRGFGSELVPALAEHLLAQPGVRRVLAAAAVDNVPSRRVLERTGFRLVAEDAGLVRYVLD